jgi:diaminohydroxyphosphoribosylaminopyrimidine deaminase / 5-amino-6-(5-phosphoribosylamino)uracil reductase
LTWTAQDYLFMSRAIQIARRGRFTCEPNPRVGCVISKGEQLIAEGWHQVTGEAHAEINALNQCDDASGSTVYLTLEPCSHIGRTPPCIEALIKAEVEEVNIAMLDPNPLVSGAGIKQLKNAGITVRQGLLEAEAIKLNPGFIKRMTSGLPYVYCKMAMSLDGRTALANGESQWISSEQSRRDVHRLRAGSSAVLTTVDTVIKDNASLNARNLEFDFKQPIRVIIDRELKVSLQAKIFSIAGKVIIYTEVDDQALIGEIESSDVEVVSIAKSDNWLIDVFTNLAKEVEVNEVMVEAGSTLFGALIEAGLIDEFIVYMAPSILGNDAQPLLRIHKLEELSESIKMKLVDVRQFGQDLRLTYNLNN